MRLTLTMIGEKTTTLRLLSSVAAYDGATDAALVQVGEMILAGAKKRTPVDTGRLRSTGYRSPVTRAGFGRYVEVGFGTHYAAKQHWAIHFRHTVGEALFLLKAVDAISQGFEATMGRLVASNVAGGIATGSIPAKGG